MRNPALTTSRPLNILFVSSCHHAEGLHGHASTRYRCHNPAEELSKLGHVVDVTSQLSLPPKIIGRYDAIIFMKPEYGRKLARTLKFIRQAGKLAIADYDDLIFNRRYALDSCLCRSGLTPSRKVIKQYGNNEKAFSLFDYFTVSTEPLYHELKRCKPDGTVAIVPNGLSRRWLDSCTPITKRDDVRTITYLPGNPNHVHDFLLVEDVLAEYTHHHPDVTLRIVGRLAFNIDKFPAGQIQTIPFQPYHDIATLIAESWLTIAPLETNRFNLCKSAIKFYESAACHTPLIATPIPDMKRHQCPGLLFAGDKDDWRCALSTLEDESTHRQASTAMRTYLEECCMAESAAIQLAEQIHDWTKQ